MESLLSTYASSDEEDEHPHIKPTFSLPPPKSSSLFSSLPKPQSSQTPISLSNPNPPSKPSALFSFLPPPKTLTTPDFHLPNPKPKKVVQFHPPVPKPNKDFHDDDEEEEDEERQRKKQKELVQDVSVKSFLSSMPVPKNSAGSTLGAAPSLGSGRRAIVETQAPEPEPTSSGTDGNGVNSQVGFDSNGVQGVGDHGYEVTVSHGSYENYANYESGNWYDASSGVMASQAPETTREIESFVMEGRRRKGKGPTQIVEVKQDELINKNRPREDLSKMTGIAFGPSYQAAPSTKGKPTKLAKRKHQIGSLYFDLKQNERELAERRSKGLLTKAETQAKYGW